MPMQLRTEQVQMVSDDGTPKQTKVVGVDLGLDVDLPEARGGRELGEDTLPDVTRQRDGLAVRLVDDDRPSVNVVPVLRQPERVNANT